jgi:hypothetical protein
MKKLLSVMAMVLLASPCFAQDDFGGGFGGGFDGVLTGSDIDALLGGGNRGGRGNQNNNGTSIPNPEQLLLQMKDLLKTKKVPLTKDQEKALKTFLDNETVAMRTELETQFYGRGNNNNNRGNTNNTTNILTQIFTTVTQHNTELLTAIKADLTPEQASLITKAEKDKKVCTVMLDLFNPQQLQNRNEGNRGNRGNNNNNNQGFNNFPGGLEGLGFEFQGGGGFPQGGNRGNNNNNNQNNNFQQAIPDRAFCTTTNSTTAERVAPISQILTKGKKPLTPDQEKKVASLIEARVPVMQEDMREKNPEMARLANSINNNNNQNRNNNNQNNTPPAVNPQTLRNNIVSTIMTQLGIPNTNNNNNNNQNNRGRGGNNPNFQNQNNPNQNNPNQNNPNQNNPNANNNNANNNNANANNNNANANNNNANNNNANANNNNRGNRGNNNFNIEAEVRRKNEELYDKMPVAAKLDPPQAAEIKKFKYAQIKARGGVERYRGIMEEEGTPLTPEQTTQIQSLMNATNQAVRQFADNLVGQEMAAVPSLEPPPLPTQNQNQNQNQNQYQNQNRNPNNVAQNPVAQQIVAKVMPDVSRRHAAQDRALTETIMRVLTPQQVASYKLSTMN